MSEPKLIDIHEDNPEPRAIRQATQILHDGGIVLIPTETGYCFVGDAMRESTHKAFIQLRKAHPTKKPFSLLCKDLSQVSACAILPTSVFRIATKAFPGPFTFILETSRYTPKFAAGKRKTVGVRVPSHKVAQALLECYGAPLLVTSVTDAEELIQEGYFDSPSAIHIADAWWTRAETIIEQIPYGYDLALNNDRPVPLSISTIIDFTGSEPVLVRDGGWDISFLGFVQK